MNAKEALKERHQRSIASLLKAAEKKTSQYGLVNSSYEVGKKVGVSSNTVINYLMGKGKDGYLREAITWEFKQLQINE